MAPTGDQWSRLTSIRSRGHPYGSDWAVGSFCGSLQPTQHRLLSRPLSASQASRGQRPQHTWHVIKSQTSRHTGAASSPVYPGATTTACVASSLQAKRNSPIAFGTKPLLDCWTECCLRQKARAPSSTGGAVTARLERNRAWHGRYPGRRPKPLYPAAPSALRHTPGSQHPPPPHRERGTRSPTPTRTPRGLARR